MDNVSSVKASYCAVYTPQPDCMTLVYLITSSAGGILRQVCSDHPGSPSFLAAHSCPKMPNLPTEESAGTDDAFCCFSDAEGEQYFKAR